MENLILEFLKKNWSVEHVEKIVFSPVPKGAAGDLAINVFALAKILGKNPNEILFEIAKILKNCDAIEKTEIAGPYLNLFFHTEKFFNAVLETPAEISVLDNRKILIEFSGPNTNKPLHLGHMRNHALGISVSRILEKAGADVFRVNMINDRGVHICKSMLAYKLFGNGETPETTSEKSDHFVGKYYVRFETEQKKDPKLNAEVQKMLIAWEKGDPEIRELWRKMNAWTLAGHAETYGRQKISFLKNYLESETYELGKKTAETALKTGIFRKNDAGAIVFDFEPKNGGEKREKIVLRADGTSIYLTNDLGNTQLKFEDFHPDEMIWVVADEQNEHFQILFAALEKLGILDQKHLIHLSYGLVNLPDGRMKSREGNVVDADNLMDDLHEIATKKIRENCKNFPQNMGDAEVSDDEISETAEKIQNAAWKYYLLRTGPQKIITFDAEKSIDFHGATGPYLQYAGVRIKSILSKSKDAPRRVPMEFFTNVEKPLGIKILEWPKTLERAATEKNPTFIATYLMELSQTWSSFYAENSVLNPRGGANDKETENLKTVRIALAEKVLEILGSGLDCLGIEIPGKM